MLSSYELNILKSINFNLKFIISVTITQLIIFCFSSLTWSGTLKIFAEKKIKYKDAFWQTAIFSVGKYIPGAFWGILARYVSIEDESSPSLSTNDNSSSVLYASLVEQIAVIHSAFILTSLFFVSKLGILTVIIACFTSIVGVVQVFKFAPNIFEYFYKKEVVFLQKKAWAKYLFEYTFALFYYSIQWSLACYIFFLIATNILNQKHSFDLFIELSAPNMLGAFVGIISFFAPGGLGVREWFTGYFLQDKFPSTSIITVLLIYRLWLILSDFVFLFLAYLFKVIQKNIENSKF